MFAHAAWALESAEVQSNVALFPEFAHKIVGYITYLSIDECFLLSLCSTHYAVCISLPSPELASST